MAVTLGGMHAVVGAEGRRCRTCVAILVWGTAGGSLARVGKRALCPVVREVLRARQHLQYGRGRHGVKPGKRVLELWGEPGMLGGRESARRGGTAVQQCCQPVKRGRPVDSAGHLDTVMLKTRSKEAQAAPAAREGPLEKGQNTCSAAAPSYSTS